MLCWLLLLLLASDWELRNAFHIPKLSFKRLIHSISVKKAAINPISSIDQLNPSNERNFIRSQFWKLSQSMTYELSNNSSVEFSPISLRTITNAADLLTDQDISKLFIGFARMNVKANDSFVLLALAERHFSHLGSIHHLLDVVQIF
jgi:hypothetical protein